MDRREVPGTSLVPFIFATVSEGRFSYVFWWPFGILGLPLVTLLLTFGSLLAPLGWLLDPFGSLLAHLGSLLAYFWYLLAPFLAAFGFYFLILVDFGTFSALSGFLLPPFRLFFIIFNIF